MAKAMSPPNRDEIADQAWQKAWPEREAKPCVFCGKSFPKTQVGTRQGGSAHIHCFFVWEGIEVG